MANDKPAKPSWADNGLGKFVLAVVLLGGGGGIGAMANRGDAEQLTRIEDKLDSIEVKLSDISPRLAVLEAKVKGLVDDVKALGLIQEAHERSSGHPVLEQRVGTLEGQR